MRLRLALSGLVLAAALAAAGCNEMAVAQGASVMATKKTVADHVISLYSGKNCSTIRTERGLTYCEEDERVPKPNVHCYQTLGEITCYDRPDPYPGAQQEVGRNDHNLIKK